jgi:hypothetical protein
MKLMNCIRELIRAPFGSLFQYVVDTYLVAMVVIGIALLSNIH